MQIGTSGPRGHAGVVPRGAWEAAAPSEISGPPVAPTPQKKFKITPSLAKIFRKLALH